MHRDRWGTFREEKIKKKEEREKNKDIREVKQCQERKGG